MALDKYDLSKKDGSWTLKKQGSERASKVFGRNKQLAVSESAKMLKNSDGASLRIHNLDGTIQEERTYPRAADPVRSKG